MSYKNVVLESGTSLELKANAVTSIRFKEVFHEDLLICLSDIESSEDMTPTDRAVVLYKLAYIMNKQALGTIGKASEKDFWNWLEEFGGTELTYACDEIMIVYAENQKPTSEISESVKNA